MLLCWDSSTSKLLRTLSDHDGHVTAIVPLGELQLVLTACMDKQIRLWNQLGECVQQIEHHKGYVSSVMPVQLLMKQQVNYHVLLSENEFIACGSSVVCCIALDIITVSLSLHFLL